MGRHPLLAVALPLVAGLGACNRQTPAERPPLAPPAPPPASEPAPAPASAGSADSPLRPLADGETYVYKSGAASRVAIEGARAQGLLVVDLSDAWAPFIFSESDAPGEEPKANPYRKVFLDLAASRVDPEGRKLRRGEQNYLEVFGIPTTPSKLLARLEEDSGRDCYSGLDLEPLRSFGGSVVYLTMELARRQHAQATGDAAWLRKQESAGRTLEQLREDRRTRARARRYEAGQARLRAVRAAQARLVCEELLSPKSRFDDGMHDLPTHEALALWERKNAIFGWGFLDGETLAALARPPLELHFETWKRILAERLADAAGIVEDGSVTRRNRPATFKDETGAVRPVPNLVGQFVDSFLAAVGIRSPDEMVAFLRSHGSTGLKTLRIAFAPPPLPPYYAAGMDLVVEIDRGDVWYDVPLDAKGKMIEQPRQRFPHLTLFARWNGQKVPLVTWRTTIGSWRSEMHADGMVYLKYKNSDIGPRVWRHIVAGPVWIPPEGTPAQDLLTRKVLKRGARPETVVDTEVMGPGFQSAYGLVMAIHVQPRRSGAFFDNQIRTHGSVDYTSIARRYSHGCHRLVNNRAVRLFSFLLRHREFQRMGDQPLRLKRKFMAEVDGEEREFRYELRTRGYYYELEPPVPVLVAKGRIKGKVKQPITAYIRKPGVDYGDGAAPADATVTLTGVGPQR